MGNTQASNNEIIQLFWTEEDEQEMRKLYEQIQEEFREFLLKEHGIKLPKINNKTGQLMLF